MTVGDEATRNAADDEAARDAAGDETAGGPASDEPPSDPVDILLVEPNPGDTRLFTESFKDAGITNRIYAVTDGESALAFLHRRGEYDAVPRPDIVLLDYRLPRNGGEDVLSDLNGDSTFEDVAVVVLTSSAAEEDVFRSNGVDADHFLRKPVTAGEFVAFVQSVEDFWLTVVREASR